MGDRRRVWHGLDGDEAPQPRTPLLPTKSIPPPPRPAVPELSLVLDGLGDGYRHCAPDNDEGVYRRGLAAPAEEEDCAAGPRERYCSQASGPCGCFVPTQEMMSEQKMHLEVIQRQIHQLLAQQALLTSSTAASRQEKEKEEVVRRRREDRATQTSPPPRMVDGWTQGEGEAAEHCQCCRHATSPPSSHAPEEDDLSINLQGLQLPTMHEQQCSPPVSSIQVDMRDFQHSLDSASGLGHSTSNSSSEWDSPRLGDGFSSYVNNDRGCCSGGCNHQQGQQESEQPGLWTVCHNVMNHVQKFLDQDSAAPSNEDDMYENVLAGIAHPGSGAGGVVVAEQQESAKNGWGKGPPLQCQKPPVPPEKPMPRSPDSIGKTTRMRALAGVSFADQQLPQKADFNSIYVPRLNYMSLYPESECSMEINALAMKYLNKRDAPPAPSYPPAAGGRGVRATMTTTTSRVEQRVMIQGGTGTSKEQQGRMGGGGGAGEVTLYGMSATNLSYTTRKYLHKYRLAKEEH